jgi:hypothetical protein
MPSVETTFKLTFTEEQYLRARAYVEDMKRHPGRVYWIGKEGMSDEELILSHIAHRILSGFYQASEGFGSASIVNMRSRRANGYS